MVKMTFNLGKALNNAGAAVSDAIENAKSVVDAAASSISSGALGVASQAKETALTVGDAASAAVKEIAPSHSNEFPDARIRKNDMIFQNSESLQQVVNVVNEASAALEDKGRTVRESSIPEVLSGVLGAGIGGAVSFGALYGLGTVGLSAAGIASGLATAGSLVGGGMVAGVGVLAAPAVILGIGGYAIASNLKGKQLKQEKERLYKEALAKHQAIIEALQSESASNKERIEYLQSLNILLERAVIDLKKDLGIA